MIHQQGRNSFTWKNFMPVYVSNPPTRQELIFVLDKTKTNKKGKATSLNQAVLQATENHGGYARAYDVKKARIGPEVNYQKPPPMRGGPPTLGEALSAGMVMAAAMGVGILSRNVRKQDDD